ncbi:MAG: V-type ATPase subunit [Nitrospinae bacterium]|nr:V-type ATPase subunit [Nitrospinota bacterium]
MNLEYLSARLAGMRSEFVTDAGFDLVCSGRDIHSAANIMAKSIFRAGIDEQGGATQKQLLSAVERGRSEIIKKTAALVRNCIPRHLGLIFSRLEMEQIKEAARHVALPRPIRFPRPSFIRLADCADWTEEWGKCGTMAEFKTLLSTVRHPLAGGFDPAQSGGRLEKSLETHYFGNFVKNFRKLSEDETAFFSDMNDLVNINSACAADRMSNLATQYFFTDGIGRIDKEGFSKLCAVTGAEFQSTASKLAGLKFAYRSGPGGFSQSLLRAYLTKWKIRNIVRPMGILDPLLFLEELNAQAANLKLAINAVTRTTAAVEPENYLIYGKIA